MTEEFKGARQTKGFDVLIPAEVFAIVGCASRSGSSRYAIAGVHVKRVTGGECVAAVTDGKVMVEVRWDDEYARSIFPRISDVSPEPREGFSANIPADLWKDVGLRIRRDGLEPKYRYGLLRESLTNAAAMVTLATDDGCLSAVQTTKVVPGDFPGYGDIIPTYTPGEDSVEIGFDPRVLAAAVATLGRATDCQKLQNGVILTVPNDKTKPVLMRVEGETVKGIAVAMPVRYWSTDEEESDPDDL